MNEKFNGRFHTGLEYALNNQTIKHRCNQLQDAITRSGSFLWDSISLINLGLEPALEP